jgi:hypothetical protein
MKNRPTLSAARLARVWKEVLEARRIYCDDRQFFKMTDVWRFLAEGGNGVKIKTYRTSTIEDYKRKAGVVAFEDMFTLVADEQLLQNADRGCKLSNYILAHEFAHEFAHLALNHHARRAVVKNFQLFARPDGLANEPPTVEELEANLGAVIFQCGPTLVNEAIDSLQLAHRAYSDVHSIRKARKLLRLDVVLQEIAKLELGVERVVL